MKALFVTSEFGDFAKTGGLGDFSADLPRALRGRGIDVRVLMPAYQDVLSRIGSLTVVGVLEGEAAIEPCLIGETRTADGLVVYLILAPARYQRRGTPYADPEGRDWPDNDVRFARLCLAAARIAGGLDGLDWTPDLVHANDWPAALAPAYIRWSGGHVPTVLTVHNLAHQGNFPADRRSALAIPDDAFTVDGAEFHNQISFLKAGLVTADHVTTVSRTYAREITTPAFGAGLHGVMKKLAGEGKLTGIVNGLEDGWEPGSDPHLPQTFDADHLAAKAANTAFVRTSLCLDPSRGPLFGIVSRLVHQKGLDLVAEIAGDLIERGGQIAILGTGDPSVEGMLLELSRGYRNAIGLIAGFSDTMAHRLVAASDFFLMPSRFEPCGLTQMQAQRYGALPIAHATGGLADTITDGETGFLFKTFSARAFLLACDRALDVFGDASRLAAMRQTAMRRDFSWEKPAGAYEAIYGEVLGRPVEHGIRPALKRPVPIEVGEPKASAA